MLLPRWLGHRATLPPALQQRLNVWRSLPAPPAQTPFESSCWVVMDTETSGLQPATDRLLAIGAVHLDRLRINLGGGFETLLRQAQPSAPGNMVIHGIGADAQRAGEAPPLALLRFLEFAGSAPLIAYHARFDAAFMQRAMREHLGIAPGLRWLDLAAVLPPLFGARRDLALDDWLLRFGIDAPVRHSALGDALATAQLAQIALRKAASRGLIHFAALQKLSADARWLPR